jgi:hypothetical protein
MTSICHIGWPDSLSRCCTNRPAEALDASKSRTGSDDEILTAIRQRQQRWGINRLVIREDAIDELAPPLPRLHETTK